MDSTNLEKSQPKIYSAILFFRKTSRKIYFIQLIAMWCQEENKAWGEWDSEKKSRAGKITGENYYLW